MKMLYTYSKVGFIKIDKAKRWEFFIQRSASVSVVPQPKLVGRYLGRRRKHILAYGCNMQMLPEYSCSTLYHGSLIMSTLIESPVLLFL